MIQLTHLGRRTRWDKANWLPVVSPSLKREAAHRAFPKKMEDWDIERIIKDYADAALADVIPIQGMANSPHLDFAGDIRAATEFPTFHAAKIPDVATARHAIASGKVDMVGMTRAHITDPHIVRKIIEKREDKIRPCVGANYCLDRSYQGGILNDIVKTLFVS